MTGKGGTGKTTVAAALGLAAVRAGKRTLVAEVAEQERIGDAFGKREIGYSETELAPGLFAFSVDPVKGARGVGALPASVAHARGGAQLEPHLRLPGRRRAGPCRARDDRQGLGFALSGKAKGASPYDLVVVDSPATGHGLAMLRAPSTIGSIARVGPIHRQAYRIHDFISDKRLTGTLAVALPEEMPVAETLELETRLGEEMAIKLDAIVMGLSRALLPFSGVSGWRRSMARHRPVLPLGPGWPERGRACRAARARARPRPAQSAAPAPARGRARRS